MLLWGKQAFSEQLVAAPTPRSRSTSTPSRSILVTGGTKGLGLELAREYLQRGAQAAVLLSRDPVLTKEQLAELSTGSKAVFTISCDASCETSLTNVMAWAREWLPAVQACLYTLDSRKVHLI